MIARTLLLATALLALLLRRASRRHRTATSSPHRCCAPASPCRAIWCGSATSSTTPAVRRRSRSTARRISAPPARCRSPRCSTRCASHQVIGVDTRDIKEISVTRLARTIEGKDIEQQVARALERKNGLGDAANLSLTFDRDPGDVRLDASNTGGMQSTIVRYEPRNTRFDVTFEILQRKRHRARRNCASPAPRSRPSRPRCWRAMSSATRF